MNVAAIRNKETSHATSQVRNSNMGHPFRNKTVQLLDDFKISGVNGTREYRLEIIFGHV